MSGNFMAVHPSEFQSPLRERRPLRLAVAQFACRTGEPEQNAAMIASRADEAHAAGAAMLLCPELSLTGYSVNPRVTREHAISLDHPAWEPLLERSKRIAIVVGFAEAGKDGICHNSAAFLYAGEIWHVHRKVYLPSYGMFDEGERFEPGHMVSTFDTPWGRMAMLICADAWHPSLAYLLAHEGADLLLVLTASPEGGLDADFDTMAAWERLNQTHALTLSMYVACANLAGEEGSLTFTGGSHLAGPDGEMVGRLPRAIGSLGTFDLSWDRLDRQRELLPFRRVDELEITLRIGTRVLKRRAEAEDRPRQAQRSEVEEIAR